MQRLGLRRLLFRPRPLNKDGSRISFLRNGEMTEVHLLSDEAALSAHEDVGVCNPGEERGG